MAPSTTNRWKLGLFVVSGLLVGFGSLVWLGAARFQQEEIPVVTYFDESVTGLQVGSEAKFRGVVIGKIAGIGIAPDQRHVKVVVNVAKEHMVQLGLDPKVATGDGGGSKTPPALKGWLIGKGGARSGFAGPELRAQLVSAGITGLKFVQVDFFDPDKYPAPKLGFETPRNYVPSVPSTFKSLEEGVSEILDNLPVIGKQVETALSRLTRLVEDVDVFVKAIDAKTLSDRTSKLLENMDATLTAIDAPALSKRGLALMDETSATLATARRAVEKLSADDGEVMKLVSRMESAVGVAEKALAEANAGKTAAALREASDSIAALAREVGTLNDEFRVNLIALRETLDAVRALVAMLERDPGALLRGRGPESAPPPPEDR
jgi:paraquat-inducible protein B